MQYGVEDASFKAAGGKEGIENLVYDFYRIMNTDEQFTKLRQLHKKDLKESEDKLSVFLCGWLGGPRLYREKYGPISIPMAHQHLDAGREEIEEWLECMRLAIELQDYEKPFAEYLLTQLRVPAERIYSVIQVKRSMAAE